LRSVDAKRGVPLHAGGHEAAVKHKLPMKAFSEEIRAGFYFRKFIHNVLHYHKAGEERRRRSL
jgi:hypothetical protein